MLLSAITTERDDAQYLHGQQSKLQMLLFNQIHASIHHYLFRCIQFKHFFKQAK